MDPETRRQMDELLELREAHRRRLRVLSVKQAQMGYSAGPAITTEIAEIDVKLTELASRIQILDGGAAEIIEITDVQALVPVSIVPKTIDERLIAVQGTIQSVRDASELQYRAFHKLLEQERED